MIFQLENSTTVSASENSRTWFNERTIVIRLTASAAIFNIAYMFNKSFLYQHQHRYHMLLTCTTP